MSESQKCQNFPVVALGGGGGGEELANTTNPKHAPWSMISSNLKRDLTSVI